MRSEVGRTSSSGLTSCNPGGSVERFRGGYPATIDAKGRVKLPARLREQMEAAYGREVYICSFFPHELRIYPLPVWEVYEEQLVNKPNTPAVLRHKERISYGQVVDSDDHGRILVPALLREIRRRRLFSSGQRRSVGDETTQRENSSDQ